MNGTLEEWRTRATKAEAELKAARRRESIHAAAAERYRAERDRLARVLYWIHKAADEGIKDQPE